MSRDVSSCKSVFVSLNSKGIAAKEEAGLCAIFHLPIDRKDEERYFPE